MKSELMQELAASIGTMDAKPLAELLDRIGISEFQVERDGLRIPKSSVSNPADLKQAFQTLKPTASERVFEVEERKDELFVHTNKYKNDLREGMPRGDDSYREGRRGFLTGKGEESTPSVSRVSSTTFSEEKGGIKSKTTPTNPTPRKT